METLKNATVGGSPSYWKFPPKYIINIEIFGKGSKVMNILLKKVDDWKTAPAPIITEFQKENVVSLHGGQAYAHNLSLCEIKLSSH